MKTNTANITDMKNMGIECISFEECMKVFELEASQGK